MDLSQLIRNAFIGKDRYILSRSVYKASLMRGYFAVLLFSIALVNGASDEFEGMTGNRWIYVMLIATSLLAFFLNRKGRTLTSSLILLLVCDFVIFLYASTYHSENGIYIFFIVSALFALSLFEYRQKVLWMSFVILPYLLFLASRYYDFHLMEKTNFNELMISKHLIANVTIAFGTSVLLLIFVINMNFNSEAEIEKSEASLVETSEALRKSRLRFELAITSSNAGIWEWDIAGHTVYNSPEWKSILGYEEHERSNVKVEEFMARVHPDDRKEVQQAIDDHLSRGIPYRLEFRMVRKDGSNIWVVDTGIAVRNAKNEIVQMVGSILDITERKEAEEKVIQQNRMLAKTNAELDRFVYSTSHDLRSPLSSLLGLISIAEKTDDQEEVVACLGMMKDRIHTMENFIKEIIDYSRNTRLQVKRDPIRLYPLINEIVENLRFSEGAEEIFVKYNVPAELVLLSDENRLRVVLNNLIGNAIKYHDSKKDNPFISIQTISYAESIELLIEDNGIGIGKEHHDRIFDMFYRASEKSHGSGLGLYIVKETIEKLGGVISVTSVHGEGTRFVIHLPILTPQGSESAVS